MTICSTVGDNFNTLAHIFFERTTASLFLDMVSKCIFSLISIELEIIKYNNLSYYIYWFCINIFNFPQSTTTRKVTLDRTWLEKHWAEGLEFSIYFVEEEYHLKPAEIF